MRIVGLLSLILFCTFPCLAAKQQSLEIWTRKLAQYEGNRSVGKAQFKKVPIKKLSHFEKFDVQYNKNIRFRGVVLNDLLQSYPKTDNSDLILLHFHNGMIVPIPERDMLKKIYLALEIENSKSYSTSFPNVAKKHERYTDPNPITFKNNKLVVEKMDHPYLKGLASPKTNDFSPWTHVGSLVGVEFVNERSYYRQFIVKKSSKNVQKGFNTFKHRCQYCHGVNLVGANYGWDFIDPLPIHERKAPEHLQNMVQLSYHDHFFRGLQMPKQKNVRLHEMKQLWEWSKAIKQQGIQKYR